MRILLSAMALFVGICSAFAQPDAASATTSNEEITILNVLYQKAEQATVAITPRTVAGGGDAIVWKSTEYDLGKVPQSETVNGFYTFTNVSDQPIYIKSAKGSCGCTGIDYPMTPILPGQNASITAHFKSNIIKPFKMDVTVETSEDKVYYLKLKGEVVIKL